MARLNQEHRGIKDERVCLYPMITSEGDNCRGKSGTEAYNTSGARYLRHLLVLSYYHNFTEQK